MKHTTAHSRFASNLFRIAVLAVLACGAASLPLHLNAQPAAPAPVAAPAQAAPAPAAQAPEAGAKPENAKEEEDENLYRHSAVVQAMARIFHLEIETAARLFEFINFGIIVLAIGIPLVRILPKMIRKRSQTVTENIETARAATADANSRLSAIEAQMAGLDAEIAKMRQQVELDSRQDEVRVKASIEEEKTRIVSAAAQEVTSAAASAKRELRQFAANLAIDQAVKQLVLTPEADQALIAEFLRDAGKGGQN